MASVSERYAFLRTAQVVSRMRKAGWAPVEAREQRVRLEGRAGFQKHLIRFQRRDLIAVKGEYAAEICLVNSHDRSSAYQLHAGLFRFICGNGLMTSDGTIDRVSIRHSGFTPDQVIEASSQILDQIPQITASVESFRARRLTPAESRAFAESAILLRHDGLATAPVGPDKLLQLRRSEDAGDSLWNTLNRVQESLCNGGLKDYSRRKADGHRFPRTRAVTGLDENIRLNKALWHLAEALKSGALPGNSPNRATDRVPVASAGAEEFFAWGRTPSPGPQRQGSSPLDPVRISLRRLDLSPAPARAKGQRPWTSSLASAWSVQARRAIRPTPRRYGFAVASVSRWATRLAACRTYANGFATQFEHG